VRVKPDDDNVVLLACSDRRLRHYDARAPPEKAAQTYEYHLSSVASVAFCDRARRFVSTGDDRQVLVWEFQVPAPVKIFAETWQAGVPTLAAHPSSRFVAGVSLDNRIVSFSVGMSTGRIARGRDVPAPGFTVGGYACEPAFSPDGRVLAVGDGAGDVWLARWGAGGEDRAGGGGPRVLRGAHRGPVVSVAWSPCVEGMLVSAGWDGKAVVWLAAQEE